MKIKLLVLVNFLLIKHLFAQVGIGTDSPSATLDVSIDSNYKAGDKAGVAFPLMTGNQIEAMSTTNLKAGTIVYANSISTNTNPDVDTVGLWYWTGSSTKKWEPLFLAHKSVVSYFYAPSIVLPTTSIGVSANSADDISYNSSTTTYRVNLFSMYQKQFSMQGEVATIKSAIKNPTATTLPTFKSTDLDYYITYFDNTVFVPSTIAISNDGVLTYQIASKPAITENTFMNIVYKVK
jgi:hypothetical protein